MRKDYTKTSPNHLYPDRQNYHSPYLSPKNNQPSYTSFQSPSQRHDQDIFEKKYPVSYKYNTINQEEPRRQIRSPQINRQQSQDYTIEISELRLTINQLRNSLQVSTQNSQRMQQELFLQRSKNIELNQVRRRMQDELKRMQFEFDRIQNYETLETRQSTIKLQNALRENSRLSIQISQLIEQVKSLKISQRKLMSECDSLLKQKQVLMEQNETLLQKLELLDNEVHAVKREVAQKSLYIQSDGNLPSQVNNIKTVRTNQASTIINSARMIPSHQSIDLQQLPQQIDYEQQNKKLQQDYNKLLQQNESMKQLYNNFYNNDSNRLDNRKKIQNINNNNNNKLKQQFFSNLKIAQKLNSSRNQQQYNNEVDNLLKTVQKQQLKNQIIQVRDFAVNQLIKIYNKIIQKSKLQHKNCIKLFIHQMIKNKIIFCQMSQNYLKIKMTIQQQTGLKISQKIDHIQPKNNKQKMILQIFKSVKQKAKNQKDLGIYIAIFRLLTIINKFNFVNTLIINCIKHAVLKFIYKLNHSA